MLTTSQWIAQLGCEMIAAREGSSQSEGPSNAEGPFLAEASFSAATAAQTTHYSPGARETVFWLVGAVTSLVSPHCVRLFSGVFVLLFVAAVIVKLSRVGIERCSDGYCTGHNSFSGSGGGGGAFTSRESCNSSYFER
jgi:hypothetical protein